MSGNAWTEKWSMVFFFFCTEIQNCQQQFLLWECVDQKSPIAIFALKNRQW